MECMEQISCEWWIEGFADVSNEYIKNPDIFGDCDATRDPAKYPTESPIVFEFESHQQHLNMEDKMPDIAYIVLHPRMMIEMKIVFQIIKQVALVRYTINSLHAAMHYLNHINKSSKCFEL